jgi:signal transduction histidine kinase
MIAAPLPANEAERLDALRRYQILDSIPEKDFDDLALLAAAIFGTPIALITLVDHDRQWFLSKVGVTVPETPRDVAFCAHAILDTDVFVVRDALADERFATNPLVTGDPFIRFYAGSPLVTPAGHALGTLCVIDRIPRELSPDQKQALAVLSRQVAVRLEMRQLLIERERTITRLQELEQLRDNLVHMIVHDLRSPLFGISGNLQLMKMDAASKLGQEEQTYLAQALSQTGVLVEMINTLLDVSRLEDGQMPLEVTPCDMTALVREALASLGQIPDQCPVVYDAPAEPLAVSCDRTVIRRVIANLVGNAVKFTPTHGVVRVVAGAEGAQVRVTVADTGPGIPPEYHEKVFQKFGQVEARSAGKMASTGLGLTFCKLAIEAHGGRIGLESAVGKGSTFWFVLPGAPRK